MTTDQPRAADPDAVDPGGVEPSGPPVSDNVPDPELPVALSSSACFALLREAVVGRLAVVVDGQPDIFPVNHVIDHGTVVFRTAEGTKLSASVGRPVAYEVDGYDRAEGAAWSVVVKGEAQEIRDLQDVLEAVRLPLYPWQKGVKPRYLRIVPNSVTGRRFVVQKGARGPRETGV